MGKSNCSKKKLYVYEKKGKTLTLCSNLELAGGDVVVDEDVDEWEPKLLITGQSDSVTVSDFKPGKWGLNSRLHACTAGEGNSSHTLPNHVTGNGRSTRHSRWVIKPTRRTARNFLSHINSSTPLLNYKHCFCDWVRRYSQVRFPAIH